MIVLVLALSYGIWIMYQNGDGIFDHKNPGRRTPGSHPYLVPHPALSLVQRALGADVLMLAAGKDSSALCAVAIQETVG